MIKLTRNEFLKLFALLVGTGGAVAACSDDGSGSNSGYGGDDSTPSRSNKADGSTGDSTTNDTSSDKDSGSSSETGPKDSGGHDSSTDSGDHDTGGNNPPPTDCAANGARGTIASNHGHNFIDVSNVIPKEHFNNPIDRTYTLTFNGDHQHTVTFSAAELTALANGQSVNKDSTTDDFHSHNVTLACL